MLITTLKKQFGRNRHYDKQCLSDDCVICPHSTVGDCAKSGVIYQIECGTCNSTYIGETGRPLRIKKHLAGKRRCTISTPLGGHRVEEHDGDNYGVKCRILAYQTEISSEKTLQAFWISSKSPGMNNCNEPITSDLAPFPQHCELWE